MSFDQSTLDSLKIDRDAPSRSSSGARGWIVVLVLAAVVSAAGAYWLLRERPIEVELATAVAAPAANGGAPMGFYTQFKDPLARQEIVRYYGFLAKHDSLYRASRPAGEVLLLFPRTRVHEGDVAAVAAFKDRGKQMLDAHVLFDILPDDLLTPDVRKRYRAVVDVTKPPGDLPAGLSEFNAPVTVRVSLDRTAAKDALVPLFAVCFLALAVQQVLKVLKPMHHDATRRRRPVLGYALMFAIGLYDGFIGPGAGMFLFWTFTTCFALAA